MMNEKQKKYPSVQSIYECLDLRTWALFTVFTTVPVSLALGLQLKLGLCFITSQAAYFLLQFSSSRKLKKKETELQQLIYTQSDKSRYQTVGEFAGLVAHDLINPLHVVKHCIETIKENPTDTGNKKYIDMLERNINRTEELTRALRARLKPSSQCAPAANFDEAHSNVVVLLTTQYRTQNFNSIKFNVSSEIRCLHFEASKIDLIHILDNLYRNSVDNLLRNKIVSPEISISLNKSTEYSHELLIRDNGTGLTKKQFEELTTFGVGHSQGAGIASSMGLRLTRRLIESLGGTLTLVQFMAHPGTTYVLNLKKPNVNKSVFSERTTLEV